MSYEIDIEASNWFASTHPGSIFTRSLVIAGWIRDLATGLPVPPP